MTPASQRNHVIPVAAWVAAAVILVAMFTLMTWMVGHARDMPLPLAILFPIIPSFLMAGFGLVAGYVYGDARRRGMRYVMWTLLAIFIPNGIGVILYFILRDPMPSYCSKCGASTKQGHAFCPACGANVLPACPQCQRAGQPGWSHCAWCGAKL